MKKEVVVSGLVALAVVIAVVAGVNHKQQSTTQTNNPSSSNPVPIGPITPQPGTPVQSQTPSPSPAESVQISSVTSPAYPGSDATLMATTQANSACQITVHYKSGPSHAAGVGPAQADGSGSVSWTWLVGTNTTPGTWPIDVSCTTNGQSASANTTFNVQ
jgi:hypothetical protein